MYCANCRVLVHMWCLGLCQVPQSLLDLVVCARMVFGVSCREAQQYGATGNLLFTDSASEW